MASQTRTPIAVTQTTPKLYINAWSAPVNAKVEDGVVSQALVDVGSPPTANRSVQAIYTDGAMHMATNVTSHLPSTLTWQTYGTPTELWGATLTPDLVNVAEFGCYLLYHGGSPTPPGAQSSTHIYPHEFNFDIPPGSIIDGVEINAKEQEVASGTAYAAIDVISMTVYYTPRNTFIGVDTITGIGSITL